MNQQRELSAKIRPGTGKGAARKLRATGETPGVVYGQGGEHLAISVSPTALRKAIDPKRKLNTWFSLKIEQEGKTARVESVMIADHQMDKVKDDILHVDFLRIDPSRPIEVRLPIEYQGRAAGVAAGGTLKTFARYIHVLCKPGDIPETFVVDVSPMQAAQTLRVRDLIFPAGKILDNGNHPIALVEPAKVKKEEGAGDKKAGDKKAAPAKAAPAKEPAKDAKEPAKDAKKK